LSCRSFNVATAAVIRDGLFFGAWFVTTGYTPIYQIFKDGADITDRFNDRTISMKITLQAGGGQGDICQISVDDRDWRVARPFNGDFLEIWLGYAEIGMAFMGLFQISDVSFVGPPRSIAITGSSTGVGAKLKTPTIQDFENKEIKDILQDIAQKDGYALKMHPSFEGIKIPFKNQVISSMHLLQELERTFGAVGKVANGQLVFTPRDEGDTASGVSMPVLALGPEHFGTWNVRHTIRSNYDSVKAPYFDKETNVRKWHEFSRPNTGNIESLLGGGPFQIGRMFNSKEEAESAAEARMGDIMRAAGEATVTLAKGDPWVRDQQQLLITGMRDGIDGSYVIQTVTHSYTKETGIETEISARPPGTGDDYLEEFIADEATKEFLVPLPGEIMGHLLLGKSGLIAGGI
jgi:uncharacterized protein